MCGWCGIRSVQLLVLLVLLVLLLLLMMMVVCSSDDDDDDDDDDGDDDDFIAVLHDVNIIAISFADAVAAAVGKVDVKKEYFVLYN